MRTGAKNPSSNLTQAWKAVIAVALNFSSRELLNVADVGEILKVVVVQRSLIRNELP